MRRKELEQLVLQMENYLECWKQFNHFINLARARSFSGEDENQFLEVKSMLTQQLEMLLTSINGGTTREEIHGLIGAAPSLRYLSELDENALRHLENQWHKVFITWQSLLGQLKVKQRELGSQGFFASFFGRNKS